jgi:hypothetical protein
MMCLMLHEPAALSWCAARHQAAPVALCLLCCVINFLAVIAHAALVSASQVYTSSNFVCVVVSKATPVEVDRRHAA